MKEETTTPSENDAQLAYFSHDRFVFKMWTNVKYARIFFRCFLPPKILEAIDLDTLELVPTRGIDERGKENIGDIFYKVGLKDGKSMALVIILEHKSTFEKYAAIQLLRYEVQTLDYMAQNPELFRDDDGLLPLPFSILLCQDDHPQLDKLVRRIEGVDYGVDTKFHSVNFQTIDLDGIRSEPLLFAIMGLSKFTKSADKKDAAKGESELLEYFLALLEAKKSDSDSVSRDRFSAFLNYTKWVMRKSDFSIDKFKTRLIAQAEGQGEPMDDVIREFFADEIEAYETKLVLAERRAEERVKRVEEEKRRVEEEAERMVQSFRKYACYDLKNRFHLDELPEALVAKINSANSGELLERTIDLIRNSNTLEEFQFRLEELLANSRP